MYSARRNVNKDSTIWRSIISDFHRSRLAKAMLARTYTKGAHRWSASYFLPFDSSHTVQPGKGSNVKLFSLIFEVGLCRAFCERFLAFDVLCCRMHGSINAHHRSRFLLHFCRVGDARVCEKIKRNFTQETEEKVHGRAAQIVFIFAIVWQPDLMLITFHVRECTRFSFPRSSTDYFFPSSFDFFHRRNEKQAT